VISICVSEQPGGLWAGAVVAGLMGEAPDILLYTTRTYDCAACCMRELIAWGAGPEGSHNLGGLVEPN